MLVLSTADEFRDKAEDCRQQSDKAVSPRDKARLASHRGVMAEAGPRDRPAFGYTQTVIQCGRSR